MRPHSTFRIRTLVIRATFFAALLVVTGVLLGYGVPAFAQGDFGIAQVDSQIGLSGTSIALILVRVIRILLGFLGLVLVIMILYGGYTIMVSAGNADKVERGKTILKNAVIGTGIVLFSFIIVQFIISILSDVTGVTPKQKQPPGIETFAGIGSLGEVIKDHYPMPNQTGVYRNTKLVITFAEVIDPSSIINNDNNTCWDENNEATTTCVPDGNGVEKPYYGDCVNGVCDTLKAGVIEVHRMEVLEDGSKGAVIGEPFSLDALVAYENGTEAHTFVFKLQSDDLLGNGETDQWHEVEIKEDKVLNTSGDDVFRNHIKKGYTWQFETNTEIDLSPPFVVDVSPNPGETIEKNRILKITFNEAVDPMTVQGMLGATSSFSNVIVDIIGDGGEYVSPSTSGEIPGEPVYEAEYQYTFSGFGDYATDFDYDSATRHLYVAYIDGTVAKLDVSGDPSVPPAPLVFDNVAEKKLPAWDIEHSGAYVYVVGGGGASSKGTLHILNATDMTEVGSYDKLSSPFGVAVHGEYAYIADGTSGIKVIDISNPEKPKEVKTLSIEGVQVRIVRTHGDRLYYGSRGGEIQFGVFDIGTSPSDPIALGETFISQTPSDIAIYGDRAYVAVRSAGIKIIDISNPESELPITQFSPQQFGFNGNYTYSLSIDNDLLAVAEQKAFKLFDLSEDPDNPTLLFSVPPEDGSALARHDNRPIWLDGESLYVGEKDDGVRLYNILKSTDDGAGEQPDTEGASGGSEGVQVSGQWKITNGYKSIEFLSSEQCGDKVNSCGEPLYCLPTACADYDKTCTAKYSVLARTASLKEPGSDSFVSAGIFDGVVDMADNSMDSSPDFDGTGSVVPGSHDFLMSTSTMYFPVPTGSPWHHKPPFVGTKKEIDEGELYPDNYWWNFTVVNDIDSTSPYVRQVYPGIDNQAVTDYQSVDVYFSKEMWLDSLTNVSLIEYPNSGVGMGYQHLPEDIVGDIELDGKIVTTTQTTLHVEHPARPFGPGDTDYWYFANVPGIVKAVNQFCLYPGRGPVSDVAQQELSNPPCEVSYDENWKITGVDPSCTPGNITITSSTDTGCASVGTGLAQVVNSTSTCINAFSDDTVSKSIFVQQ